MSVELALWFAGCVAVLLFILFAVRPYILAEHDDELEVTDKAAEPRGDPENRAEGALGAGSADGPTEDSKDSPGNNPENNPQNNSVNTPS